MHLRERDPLHDTLADSSPPPATGQSVPHVHVHLIPRFASDFTPIDDIYPALAATNLGRDQRELSAAEATATSPALPAGVVPQPKAGRGEIGGPDAEERKPRSKEEMETEARELSALMPEGNRGF